ncbi:23S rRNA accumulation protein YceD [Salinivibrio kushneri]|uniref:Large ribosomal RNA subunit accumulation protein YceD n=1 Tax=Salinivibrio kushneri TaxID=1908198 RepID=A0AA47KJ50_9GAMM|nr:23S rRNA accumulation protein YceD [Salinivibrio kushneri]WBA07824.1 23S rRNA accumulation protein YceD [Salinivibrio kushneri]
MQKVKLPLTVDPFRCAQKQLDYDGIVDKQRLLRLGEATQSIDSDAEVMLSFDIDAQGLKTVTGRATVSVSLECQRCWEPFSHRCETEFVYSPVFNDDQVGNLPDAYEPALVDENGEIDLIQLVEDELIVALPQVAMHEDTDCKVSAENMVYGEIPLADERPNPFAVLKNLKQSNEE